MNDFKAAHGSAQDWHSAATHCLDELGTLGQSYRLGFLYVTDHWADAIGDIMAVLARGTGVSDWVGTVGIGICASGREYFDEPAMAVMVAALPAEAYRV
ncbi:MAG: histidine kinase, partial [Kiloniellales bacterium]